MESKTESKIVKLGIVGVDSGMLVICDPSYINTQYETPEHKDADHAHAVYRHAEDNSLWQYCYGGDPTVQGVKPIPGNYSTIVPEYGKTANQLIEEKLFIETDMDPTPHIPLGEFSYRGMAKARDNDNQGGQLNFTLGHPGAAVAFSSGLGDGEYEVFAEIVDTKSWGFRVKKVWVELLTDEDVESLRKAGTEERGYAIEVPAPTKS